MEWILFTCLAAFMQAVRTAAQKHLAKKLSSITVTAARYLFGLPFIVIYYYLVSENSDEFFPSAETEFFMYALVASLAQIIATVCLIQLFTLRNFAIGTSYAKTEALQVAVIGSVFFSEALSVTGWISVIVGVTGLFIISTSHTPEILNQQNGKYTSILSGLSSGAFFAITSLCLRQASLSLGGDYLVDAAFTLLFMVVVQTVLISLYLVFRRRQELIDLFKHTKAGWFIGVTGALGSIGWFTAMTLQNAAYVKALGQVEFFFTLLITSHVFKERITVSEIAGMLMILISVVLLVNYA